MKKLEEVLRDWEAVIGLEVHVELTSLNTKMFCGCKIEYGAEPNTHTCPVCLGLPGALPVPNKEAIESIVLAGLATNCEIEKRSMFYRKNYMYPDMPKNFQITQGPVAFCMRGWLDIDVDDAAAERLGERVGGAVEGEDGFGGGYRTRVGITRIHMEEDAGKMVHVGGSEGRISGATRSLVDCNRAGTPLIELVTEPDLRTPEEARLFVQKLRQIFRAIGISDCSMEEGSLRCDGNVSLRRRGDTRLGTKTELKNVNSFKSLHDGLAYEIRRQAEVLESGGSVLQETRHWDPSAKWTVVMRAKETADDYRLFPDPDLAPFVLSDEFIEAARRKMPELPERKEARLRREFGLSPYDARQLIDAEGFADFFVECMEVAAGRSGELAKGLANMLINDVAAHLKAEGGIGLADTSLTPERLTFLASAVREGDLSSKQSREVLRVALSEDKDPAEVIDERGMSQISDVEVIGALADAVIDDNPEKVAAYQAGKTGLIGYFVGQCMKLCAGQGNPRVINEVLKAKLG